MAKKKSKPWGIWITSLNSWLMDGRKKARYELRREAVAEAHDFNYMWKGRKNIYEVRKIK